jgi:two-component system, NtrC family, nitrogen regulation response regulator NtrX
MVLVVEDDADSSDIMARFLKRLGFEVRCAATAGEALDAMKGAPIRVAVLDYNLPDHDGLWLLRQMNDDPDLAEVRAIFVSGTFTHETARQAIDLGAAEWFIKGVHSVSRVMETVERLHGPKE